MINLIVNRWSFVFGLCLLILHQAIAQNVDELIEVSLIAEAESLKLGDRSKILVEVKLADGWHVYSEDAGESGLPTQVQWDVSNGLKIQNLDYPEPAKYEQDGIISNIHKGTFYLRSEVSFIDAENYKKNEISISAQFSALVCSAENCIPYDSILKLVIPIGAQTVLNQSNKVFFESVSQHSESPASFSQTVNKSRGESAMKQLLIMFSFILIAMSIWALGKVKYSNKKSRSAFGWRFFALFLFIFGIWLGYPKVHTEDEYKISWLVWSPEKEKSLREQGRGVFIDFTARWCASCQINKRVYAESEIIDKFKDLNIVPLQADWTKRGSVIFDALQEYGRVGVPLYVYYPPDSNGASEKKAGILLPEILSKDIVLSVIENEKEYIAPIKDKSFWTILGFAFLGGVILNLMPCVFPVLGLKVMSFVKQAGEDAGKVRKHGIIFTAGVVLSFWILVGILMVLRESLGENLGWGFQLQEPLFVFFLAVILLVFGLSLSGVFEIGMSFVGMGSQLSGKSGYMGSFFSGFLATLVATPCMAPFLGVAVGAALTMPLLSSFVIFTAIALGLSFPYLLLSVFPKWISKLPRPGAWMDTLKEAMAFPIYATVAWLLWTLYNLI